MCDYQCKPLYTFHEGGGGGQSRVLGFWECRVLGFWECKGAVCVWQCIFSNPEGGTKDLRGAIKPPLNETPLTGSLSIVNGCLFFFH